VRALLLALLLAAPALTQHWALITDRITLEPTAVYYDPTPEEMICALLLGGEPSGAARPVIVSGADRAAAALGCPSTPPVVVWGDDGTGGAVYALRVLYLFYGPYDPTDPDWGTDALAAELAANWLAHFAYTNLPNVAQLERFGLLVEDRWRPQDGLPATHTWAALPGLDDYIDFGTPTVRNPRTYSGRRCTYYTGTSTCWRAWLVYSLPVRLVLKGTEPGVEESLTASVGDPPIVERARGLSIQAVPRLSFTPSLADEE